jgi:hypothetical protein
MPAGSAALTLGGWDRLPEGWPTSRLNRASAAFTSSTASTTRERAANSLSSACCGRRCSAPELNAFHDAPEQLLVVTTFSRVAATIRCSRNRSRYSRITASAMSLGALEHAQGRGIDARGLMLDFGSGMRSRQTEAGATRPTLRSANTSSSLPMPRVSGAVVQRPAARFEIDARQAEPPALIELELDRLAIGNGLADVRGWWHGNVQPLHAWAWPRRSLPRPVTRR